MLTSWKQSNSSDTLPTDVPISLEVQSELSVCVSSSVWRWCWCYWDGLGSNFQAGFTQIHWSSHFRFLVYSSVNWLVDSFIRLLMYVQLCQVRDCNLEESQILTCAIIHWCMSWFIFIYSDFVLHLLFFFMHLCIDSLINWLVILYLSIYSVIQLWVV